MRLDPIFTEDIDQSDYETQELCSFDGSNVIEERGKKDKFPKFRKE